MALADTLADYGLDPMKLAFGLAIATLVMGFFLRSQAERPEIMKIELHPEHVEYMKKKEEKYCSGNFGKGLRCIIDCLREEGDDLTKEMFAEKPKYSENFESYEIDIHPQQFEWLEENDIKVSTEEGGFNELSRVSRAMLDWAMRQESEGKDQDYTLFELIRCLNC